MSDFYFYSVFCCVVHFYLFRFFCHKEAAAVQNEDTVWEQGQAVEKVLTGENGKCTG